jgi:diguanylate cyclase (GGDEF)-like protein
MPKAGRQDRAAKPRTAPKRARPSQRRLAEPIERVETPARPGRADAVRLAGEVARLELELARAREQVAELAARAQIDPLTDILNRRGLDRELRRSLAHVKRYGVSAALIYVDLDDFKRINDRHGHAAGDAVLKAVAMVLGRHIRESDVAARLGGDEFVLLLWNCNEADAQVKADAVEAAIARMTATHAGSVLQVGASCGVAPLLPLDRPQDLLERADRAMYVRKAERRRAFRVVGA